MKHAAAVVASLSIVAVAIAACSSGDSEPNAAAPTSSTGGAAGVAGAAGAGGATAGSAGMGDAGAPACEPGVIKGPWSLHVDATSARVRWQTCKAGSKAVSFSVEGGADAKAVDATETPYKTTFRHPSALSDAPADEPGDYFIYEATLGGLAASTCYTFSVAGDAAKKGRVCAARKPGDPFTFLAIGDTNPALGATEATVGFVLPKKPDFTVHGGDIQYYTGLETWAYWFPKMQPLLAAGALMPAVGNHESEKPDEYAQYFSRFFGDAGFDGSNGWYTFASGGLHYFALNTEREFGADSEQGKWLIAKLEAASQTPGFRGSVLYQHRPFFTCGDSDHHPDEQKQLEPSMLKFGVKLVLQAHMHGYERFEKDGILYVTTGGGGGAITNGGIDDSLDRAECPLRQASGGFPHATVLDVDATSLKGTVIDSKGATRDMFTTPLPAPK